MIVVPVVVIEETSAVEVPNEQVQKTIVVVIAPRDGPRIAAIIHRNAVEDFGERPVTVVVIEKVVLSEAVGDEQIEPAVIVIIAQLQPVEAPP